MTHDIQNLLLHVFIDFLVFLEFSSDQDLNSDIAIKYMEEISHKISKLEESDKATLFQLVRKKTKDLTPDQIKYLENLSDNLG